MSAAWTPGSASRMPEPTPERTPGTAEVFARVAASRGWVSNLLRSLGHAPEALARFSALGHHGRYGNALSERQRELVIVIVGCTNAYAWAHHAPLALDAGVTEAELAALSPREATDVAMLAAYYLAAGSLIIGLGVKVEPPEVLAIERAWQQQSRLGDQVVAQPR